MVVAAMHAVGDLQRMGNLAQHIAKIARMKHPRVPIPGEVRPGFARMGVLASSLAQDAARAIESRDPMSADRLAQDDEEVDALRRRTFRILFSEDWLHGVEPAVDTRADRPLLRALRRPRGGDRAPGQLPRHRPAARTVKRGRRNSTPV
jgi:phosphate transport system protein